MTCTKPLFSSAKPAEPRKPLARSSARSMAEIEDVDDDESTDQKNEENPVLASIFDPQFVDFIKSLEADIRESILEIHSHPKSKVAVVPAELEQKSGEGDADYNKRLKAVVGKQYSDIQDLLNCIATLVDDSSNTGGTGGSSHSEARVNGSSERVQSEALHRDLQDVYQQLEMLKMEKSQTETDLKSLSDAYNSLEQANYHLENEIKALKAGGAALIPDVESIKAEARKKARRRVRQN